MMKLSRRIRDLVRANLASPRWFSGLGKARSPAQLEAQLEQIRKSLTQAAGREKGLRDDLVLAEGEGRERDAIRLRRELVELNRSTDELRATLDLIEARIEAARESKGKSLPRHDPMEVSTIAEGTALPQASLAESEEGADLPARKARLAAPEEKGESEKAG